MIVLKSKREIDKMSDAGHLTALAHMKLRTMIEPGITTKELDRFCEAFIISNSGRPAFKGYRGFPSSICVAVNEQVVHGIPGDYKLRNGDIISIDIGVEYEGYYADAARTWPVGKVSKEAELLIDVTENALNAGIDAAQVPNRLSNISHAIEKHVLDSGHSVVKNFVGHGIGRMMHEEPQVPNFGNPGWGPRIKPGMTLAIEPMVNIGGCDVELLSDKWTVVTKDRSLSAHFEDTIAITDSGVRILTRTSTCDDRKEV